MALPLLALLIGAVVQIALGSVLSPKMKGWLAALSGLVAFAATLALLPSIAAGGNLEGTIARWDQGIGLSYHVDGLSLVFMLMATGIGSAILLYCVGYMAHEPAGTTRFYTLMLIFIAGLVNLVCSANLLLAYLSWEAIGLCSYLLVGFWYKQEAAANGARKVLVITHLAGYGLLAAILLLYTRSGTFLWTDPALGAAFSTSIFALLLAAAMAKSVMFPLHSWIPEAMNAPTPVSALLHSACYVKAGVYLIARLYTITPWQPSWHTLVVVIGCATMLVGALFAFAQTDLKRLLAFSTISQLGYIVTALGIGGPLGMTAALFYAISHGLFKGTLFLCAGAVQHAAGTRDMRQLGGLARAMPQTARIWLIATAAIVGIPLTNGFIAKWLLFDAALSQGYLAAVAVAWLVSTFTAFYMLKATVSVFYGEQPTTLQVHEASAPMLAGMWALAGLCLVFGVAPQAALLIVAPAVQGISGTAVALSWLGIQTASAGASVTIGAGLMLLMLAAGGALYRVARPAYAGGVAAFTGGDPLPLGNSLGPEDFAELAETTLKPVYEALDPDPFYLAVWRFLRSLAVRLDGALAPIDDRYPVLAAAVLALLVGVIIWLV